jgi:hypothetical protein
LTLDESVIILSCGAKAFGPVGNGCPRPSHSTEPCANKTRCSPSRSRCDGGSHANRISNSFASPLPTVTEQRTSTPVGVTRVAIASGALSGYGAITISPLVASKFLGSIRRKRSVRRFRNELGPSTIRLKVPSHAVPGRPTIMELSSTVGGLTKRRPSNWPGLSTLNVKVESVESRCGARRGSSHAGNLYRVEVKQLL